jgi:hypothetical protein
MKNVEYKLRDIIYTQIYRQIRYQIENKARKQIGGQVQFHEINYQTFHQVERMVNDQIRTRIYWQVNDKI